MKNRQLNKTLAFKTGKDILNLLESKENHSSNSTFSPPSTEAESALFGIWKTVLGHDGFGVTDDFFKIGGNSLKAVQLISRISRRFNVNINLTDIFLQPTIIQLAAHILNPQKDLLSSSTIEIKTRPKHIPLSFSQERLWFIDQLEGSTQYHLPYVLRLKGNLHQDAMDYALQTFVNRHEILRTVIRSNDNGVGYQFIKDENTWQLSRVDGFKYVNKPNELNQYIASLIREPFDLSHDHLLRATLIKLTEKESIFVATLHHIASDGWSKSIFVKELVQLYNAYKDGSKIDLPQLNLQYADYAIWQRNHYQGEWFSNKLSYWKRKLEGISTLAMPTDYLRPPVQSTKGNKIDFTIDEELLSGLQLLSQQQGVTLFMTLLSGFKVLLHRYSGQEDISVGTPMANRTLKEVEELVGFFVNTLVLRSEVNSNLKFIEFLQQFKATALEAYEQQDVPFEKVVEAVVKERDMGRNPLFQVMFILQNVPPLPSSGLSEVEVSREVYESNTSQFDLTFIIRESAHGLNAAIEYCTDLFNEETIVRMIRHYKELLNSIVKEPNEKIGLLPMLTWEEEHQLLVEFNNTAAEYPKDKTIIDLFEDQVAKSPNAVAVVFEEEKLNYQQLNERANQLAHYLRSRGVKEETLVPICIERSMEMIIGILGILKAAGAYVPIDPSYPQERINFMLADIIATILITNKKSHLKLQISEGIELIELHTDWKTISTQSIENLQTRVQPHNLAYIIYTSGSTGKPKGVMIEHSSIINYLLNNKCRYIGENEVGSGSFIHLSYTFDASLTAMFMPLLSGKSVILGSKQALEVFEDSNLHKYAPYNFIKITPSHLELLRSTVEGISGNWLTKKLVIGGEALHLSQFDYLVENGVDVEIINEYGPTEATVGCSNYNFQTLRDNQELQNNISIGKPIDNAQIYILNDNNELMPVGVVGELCIGGTGVARGYLNRPELTAEKFIKNPFTKVSGERIYKTGDLARWQADGNIEYLGRKDDQVKIRGYRIELDEIVSVLQQSGLMRQAVVLARENKDGGKQLVGYGVPDGAFDREALIIYLKSKLPEYMVPTLWVELQSLPLTPNGKIDKKALPDFDPGEVLNENYVVPRNETERIMAEIWEEVLEVEKVRMNNNFFELGGHSLMILKLASRVRKLGLQIEVKDFFKYQTIEEQSNFLKTSLKLLQTASEGKFVIPIQPEGNRFPLFGIPEFLLYSEMGKYISKQQPFFSIEHSPHETVAEVVNHYITEIKTVYPHGPYGLMGFCGWGKIVLEIAQTLIAQGDEVPGLVLIEYYSPGIKRSRVSLKFIRGKTKFIINNLRQNGSFINKRKFLFKELKFLLKFINKKFKKSRQTRNSSVIKYSGKVILFQASETYGYKDDLHMGWKETLTGDVKKFIIKGDHLGMMASPIAAAEMAEILNTNLIEQNKDNKN
jgi:amino acid adenylation domain-containing protein